MRESGVGPVTMVTEPAAAAVHFASTERADDGDVLLVYDLGGGTFDTAVLRRTATEFALLGRPEGIARLGGVDFDDGVFSHVLAGLGGAGADLDPDDPAVVAALARLRRECTAAKEALSTDSETLVDVALPGVATAVRLTRAEFEDMVRPAVEQTLGCLQRALTSAGVTREGIRTVVLVGGSARIPLVAEVLGRELGRPVAVSLQPKHAVALGAALLAGGAVPRRPAGGRRAGSGSRCGKLTLLVNGVDPPAPLQQVNDTHYTARYTREQSGADHIEAVWRQPAAETVSAVADHAWIPVVRIAQSSESSPCGAAVGITVSVVGGGTDGALAITVTGDNPRTLTRRGSRTRSRPSTRAP